MMDKKSEKDQTEHRKGFDRLFIRNWIHSYFKYGPELTEEQGKEMTRVATTAWAVKALFFSNDKIYPRTQNGLKREV